MTAAEPVRVVILGGGFAGVHAAIELERAIPRDAQLEITIVNRDNFILFTPMLREVAASDLDVTHIVNPIRRMVRRAVLFVGEVEAIDLETRQVVVRHARGGHEHELPYDHLVLALGSVTNFFGLPGLEERALTMKSLGDAIALRNRLIEVLEEADFECAAAQRNDLLTILVTRRRRRVRRSRDDRRRERFLREAIGAYPRLSADMVRLVLVHSGKAILPELHPKLGDYAARVLSRRGVEVRLGARVTGASIGRRTGVASIMGASFSGFLAWWMWRTIYLSKLPGLDRKIRVALDWTLDLLLEKDLVQLQAERSGQREREVVG